MRELKIFALLAVVAFSSFVGAEDPKKIACYKCESTAEDRKCIDKPTEVETCESESLMCFTKKKDNGVVERGCLVITDLKACEEDENCQKSFDDKGNSAVVTSKPALKCYTCDDCSGTLDEKLVKPCEKEFPYGLKEQCFVKTTKTDDKTTHKRGCFYDLSAQDQTDCKDCTKCDTDGCNKDTDTEPPKPTEKPTTDTFTCIVCRSDMANQKSCASKELKEADLKDFSKQCEATPKGEEDYACYIQRLKNNVVVRDCISTAKALSLNINENACDATKDESTKCNFCKGKDCNKGEPRNSGTHLQVVTGLVAFAAIFVTKYL